MLRLTSARSRKAAARTPRPAPTGGPQGWLRPPTVDDAVHARAARDGERGRQRGGRERGGGSTSQGSVPSVRPAQADEAAARTPSMSAAGATGASGRGFRITGDDQITVSVVGWPSCSAHCRWSQPGSTDPARSAFPRLRGETAGQRGAFATGRSMRDPERGRPRPAAG